MQEELAKSDIDRIVLEVELGNVCSECTHMKTIIAAENVIISQQSRCQGQ